MVKERKEGRKEERNTTRRMPTALEFSEHMVSRLGATFAVVRINTLPWNERLAVILFFLLLALTFAFLAALLLLPVFGLPDVGLPPERPDAGLVLNPEVGRKEFPELSCSSTP